MIKEVYGTEENDFKLMPRDHDKRSHSNKVNSNEPLSCLTQYYLSDR